MKQIEASRKVPIATGEQEKVLEITNIIVQIKKLIKGRYGRKEFLNISQDVEQNDKEVENMKEKLRDEGSFHLTFI